MPITETLVPEELGLTEPILVGAFMNWPDASFGASGAVRFLVEALHAAALATWDGDEYYDFVELRPVSRVVPPRDRTLVWPMGEFWVARAVPRRTVRPRPRGAPPPPAPDAGTAGEPASEDAGPTTGGGEAENAPDPGPRTRSLVLFLAPEPRLRWRSYGRELAAFARRCGVTEAVFFGAAYADVPHTRPPIVTGWATEPRLRDRLDAAGVAFSAYQGPSSMQSAALEACREAGIAGVSLFGNGPSYLTIPNANVSLGLLRRFALVFDVRLDLAPLRETGETLIRQVNAAVEERANAEFREHVRRLEEHFDEQSAPLAPGEVRRQLRRQQEEAEAAGPLNVDPKDVVRELEDFLRRRSQRPAPEDDGEGTAGGEPGSGPTDRPPESPAGPAGDEPPPPGPAGPAGRP